MIRLRIVRHGEPAWEVDGFAVDDPGLTDQGVREIRALRERISEEHFDSVYVGPLRRAMETARPLGDTLGLEPQVCDWLAELGHPPFEGKLLKEVEDAFLQGGPARPQGNSERFNKYVERRRRVLSQRARRP